MISDIVETQVSVSDETGVSTPLSDGLTDASLVSDVSDLSPSFGTFGEAGITFGEIGWYFGGGTGIVVVSEVIIDNSFIVNIEDEDIPS